MRYCHCFGKCRIVKWIQMTPWFPGRSTQFNGGQCFSGSSKNEKFDKFFFRNYFLFRINENYFSDLVLLASLSSTEINIIGCVHPTDNLFASRTAS